MIGMTVAPIVSRSVTLSWIRHATSKREAEVVSEGSFVPEMVRHHNGGRGGLDVPLGFFRTP